MSIRAVDASNQFRGKIVEIIVGAVMSEIEVETSTGRVASIVTTRSVHDLGLEIGAEVIAFVKATDVGLAKV